MLAVRTGRGYVAILAYMAAGPDIQRFERPYLAWDILIYTAPMHQYAKELWTLGPLPVITPNIRSDDEFYRIWRDLRSPTPTQLKKLCIARNPTEALKSFIHAEDLNKFEFCKAFWHRIGSGVNPAIDYRWYFHKWDETRRNAFVRTTPEVSAQIRVIKGDDAKAL